MRARKQVHAWKEASLIAAVVLVGVMAVHTYAEQQVPDVFVSSEVRFTDSSRGGLAIVPASCASSPSWYHNNLTATADGGGYISQPGTYQYGVSRNGVHVCVSNFTDSSYFVPGNSAAEMNAFKAIGTTTIPNLGVW